MADTIWDDKKYNSRLQNRAESLKVIDELYAFIKSPYISDDKKEKLRDLRGRAVWMFDEQVKNEMFYILNN
jgi:hypothetical protein